MTTIDRQEKMSFETTDAFDVNCKDVVTEPGLQLQLQLPM